MNKHKLLSSISVDEFKLFLPNVKNYVEELIKSDDIELITKIIMEVKKIEMDLEKIFYSMRNIINIINGLVKFYFKIQYHLILFCLL